MDDQFQKTYKVGEIYLTWRACGVN
jgi:hypothetical protein